MSAECHDDVCITCSDQLLAMVVTVVDAAAGTAHGTIDGTPVEVSVELIDEVEPGEVLLCHGGVALQRGSPAEVEA
jgi:hydrogenase maturation factor